MSSSTSGAPQRPLLTISGTNNEWRRSSAYYSRVTVHQHCGLKRPSGGFQISNSAGKAQWGAHGLACSSYLRRDFMDLGNVSNSIEMGKLDLDLKSKIIIKRFLEFVTYIVFQIQN